MDFHLSSTFSNLCDLYVGKIDPRRRWFTFLFLDYAQMAITILRTYYNFCKPYKVGNDKKTHAQFLGIADKVYSWDDIIYKR